MKKLLLSIVAIGLIAITSSTFGAGLIFGGAEGYSTTRDASRLSLAGSSGAAIFGVSNTRTTMFAAGQSNARNITTPIGNESNTNTASVMGVNSTSAALGIAKANTIFGGGTQGTAIAAGRYGIGGIGIIAPQP